MYCTRVGGGFGGKQEVISEDLAALATLETGRPVCFEYTREEEFTTASPTASDDIDGQPRRESRRNTHRIPSTQCVEHRRLRKPRRRNALCGRRRRHALPLPNKKYDAYSVYTNTVPSGALRGYGMTQPAFAVESAMHELALALHIDPLELRRRNIVRPGDPLVSMDNGPDDVTFSEDGLRKCIDLVDAAMARTADEPPPRAPDGSSGPASRVPCASPRPRPSTSRRPGSRSATT